MMVGVQSCEHALTVPVFFRLVSLKKACHPALQRQQASYLESLL